MPRRIPGLVGLKRSYGMPAHVRTEGAFCKLSLLGTGFLHVVLPEIPLPERGKFPDGVRRVKFRHGNKKDLVRCAPRSPDRALKPITYRQPAFTQSGGKFMRHTATIT